tara:strand:- start:264 stop:6536 length:6273 start_codon:yes stop_codon:yes gene_type:complete
MSDAAGANSSNPNISLVSITKQSLSDLIKCHKYSSEKNPTGTDFEFKKSAAAFLSRKKSPSIVNTPISILPGSRQKFQIHIDNAGQFNFSSTQWKDGSGEEPTQIYIPSTMVSQRKVTDSVPEDTGLEFIDDIWFIQQYLQALESRSSITEQEHLLIPASLLEAIKKSEGIFENEGIQSFTAMKSAMEDFKKWLLERVNQLYAEFKKLEEYIARSNNVNSAFNWTRATELNPELIHILFHFDATEYSTLDYLCSENRPNPHNHEVVSELIKNGITDLLLPLKWLSDKKIGALDHPNEPLVLRLTNPLSFTAKYAEVKKTLEPVKKALESDRDKNPDTYGAAIQECNEILGYCDSQTGLQNIVTYSPASLLQRITGIIEKYSLTQIMKDEISRNFSGIYNKLLEEHQQNIPDKVLEKLFVQLNSIKYVFDECASSLRMAQKYIREGAVISDSERIRESADEQISIFKNKLNEFRIDDCTPKELDEKVRGEMIAIEEWYIELQSSLSDNGVDKSVLWIGLGQAGGQILRECLLYCLSNLSDARCTALLTAIGINPSDLKDVHKWTKNIYSSQDEKKTKAEKDLMALFDRKAHVLAINLGEEVDALADSDQPGYFLWGDIMKSDNTSSTQRTTKNILKLKSGGQGAGGRTGVGRAYGFRFMKDISDVLKDVGRKGHSNPKHIVITHSLAGGSGSGMVLPVLQQARRTFGPDPIIWVISVGEGASEDNQVAMVNTPFIISDILQANYDGIHAISQPIDEAQWRSFAMHMEKGSEEMEKSLLKFIQFNSESYDKDKTLVTNLNTILDGGYNQEFSRVTRKMADAYTQIKDIKVDPLFEKLKAEPPINIPENLTDDAGEFMKESYLDLMKKLNEMLPSDNTQALAFTSWCKTQALGGNRPAAQFWQQWLKCQFDPLSLFLVGRERDLQTTADGGEETEAKYFAPKLTSTHLKLVMNRVYHEAGIKQSNNQIPPSSYLAPGMTPLLDVIEVILRNQKESDKKETLGTLKSIFDEYGSHLDRFNEAKRVMTTHINSLAGAGSDPLIKSIIVSNLHLENGVNSTSHLESSGKAYTVYNSVIFDLMLNIIGPQLATESGVFEQMDETFDHMDLVGSTSPPLVIGLLNQRDSISLTEPPIVRDSEIEPSDLGMLLNSIMTQPVVNTGGKNKLENILFVKEISLGRKLPILFKSMFGSRFKYMLQINPYDVIASPIKGVDEVSAFTEQLNDLWNDSSDKLYSLDKNHRDNLSKNSGVSGLHIVNLIRWFSLISPETLSRFISEKKLYGDFLEKVEKPGTLWTLMDSSRNDLPFDIGILRNDPTIQSFTGKDQNINQDNLYRALPNMGIKNAEILRSVAPAYLNSHLPMELLFGCEKFDYNTLDFENSGVTEQYFEEQTKKGGGSEFIEKVLQTLKDDHSLGADGRITSNSVKKLMARFSDLVNCILSSIDLQIKEEQSSNSKDPRYSLTLHPRLNRYFSAVRDIPIRPTDKILPSRSASASLSRYIHSDSMERPLDPDYIKENRSGIAAPTFVFGGQIMNQMRNTSLLPDERKLSLIPLVRMLLLGSSSSNDFQQRLSSQFQNIGLDIENYNHHFVRIFGENVYKELEIFNEPGVYGGQIKTIIGRLHDSKQLFLDLITNLPSGWDNDDLAGLNFLLWILEQEEIAFESRENSENIFGGNVAAIPKVREWLRDVISIIVNGTFQADVNTTNDAEKEDNQSSGEEDMAEPKRTVSMDNSTIVGLKQLFYDISYLSNEGLGQAEYLKQGKKKKKKNVHFEMTGFSDRLIGKPNGLLLLIHDRNPKLSMDKIQASIRQSIVYSFGSKIGTKAFSTAADFGPSSYLTAVLQKAPAAGISDQFQMLLSDPSNGLVGSNSFYSFDETKLNPYILLYNILWLSANLPEWTSLDNKEYMRRFQIPKIVIEKHYSDPIKLDNDRLRLENDKISFENDVKMPEDDKRDYLNALKGEHSDGRNILNLIGLMALRHELAAGITSDKVWKKCGLNQGQYDSLLGMYQSKAEMMTESHLIDMQEDLQEEDDDPWGGWGGADTDEDENTIVVVPDTLKDRAIAWFNAYNAWSTSEPEPTGNVSQIDSFEATLPGEDL